MKIENFILNIIRKIESLDDSVIAYAYQESNESKTHTWWEIACDNVDMYLKDERFKMLKEACYKTVGSQGVKIIFVACEAKEEKLIKLLEENNLLINT